MGIKMGWWQDVWGGWKKERLLAKNPEEKATLVVKRTLACSQALIEKQHRESVHLGQKALRMPARSP